MLFSCFHKLAFKGVNIWSKLPPKDIIKKPFLQLTPLLCHWSNWHIQSTHVSVKWLYLAFQTRNDVVVYFSCSLFSPSPAAYFTVKSRQCTCFFGQAWGYFSEEHVGKFYIARISRDCSLVYWTVFSPCSLFVQCLRTIITCGEAVRS